VSQTILPGPDRQKILAAIRARIAGSDHQPIDPGHLADLMALVETNLPQLVGIARTTPADRIEPYQEAVQEAICDKCRYQSDSGVCKRRLSGACLLWAYLQPIVEGIDAFVKDACSPVHPQAPETPKAFVKGTSMFNRILIGIDDSESARRAVLLAADLQAKFGSRVALLHAINTPVPYGPEMIDESRELEKIWMERSAELVKSMRSLFPAGAQVESFVVTGPPADQLISHAESWNADVVIVGNHNRGAISRFLLGSTADRVVRRSPCPVLVAREPQDTPATHKGSENDATLAASGAR
jgi:nucleotide-binding universal stress UspA family protein